MYDLLGTGDLRAAAAAAGSVCREPARGARAGRSGHLPHLTHHAKDRPVTQQLFAWLDERLDLSSLRAFIAEKTVPRHRHSIWYYMGGITCLFPGRRSRSPSRVLLPALLPAERRRGLRERPVHRQSQVEFGWLIRNLHSWSAKPPDPHGLRAPVRHKFFLRSYRKPRELTSVTWRAAALRHDGLRVQRLPPAVERARLLRHEGRHRHRRRGAARSATSCSASCAAAMT